MRSFIVVRRPMQWTLWLSAALVALAPGIAGGQQPAAANVTAPTPEVGTMAPDFTIGGTTRYGLLRDSVRLSDFRGQTVVLAFFIKARTKG
jgi:peroxiredoxin Q/BCP